MFVAVAHGEHKLGEYIAGTRLAQRILVPPQPYEHVTTITKLHDQIQPVGGVYNLREGDGWVACVSDSRHRVAV